MGNILSPKVKKFQPSEDQKAAEAAQREQAASQQSEMVERTAMRKRARAGRTSLLTGAATGVEEKQTTLG